MKYRWISQKSFQPIPEAHRKEVPTIPSTKRYLKEGPYKFIRREVDGLGEECGLFVLYNARNCVLAGYTSNLRMRIAHLLERPTECLQEHRPTFFEVSPVHPGEINSRFEILLGDLKRMGDLPLCGVEQP